MEVCEATPGAGSYPATVRVWAHPHKSGGLCSLREVFRGFGSWPLVDQPSGSLMYPGSLTSQRFWYFQFLFALTDGNMVHTPSLGVGELQVLRYPSADFVYPCRGQWSGPPTEEA